MITKPHCFFGVFFLIAFIVTNLCYAQEINSMVPGVVPSQHCTKNVKQMQAFIKVHGSLETSDMAFHLKSVSEVVRLGVINCHGAGVLTNGSPVNLIWQHDDWISTLFIQPN